MGQNPTSDALGFVDARFDTMLLSHGADEEHRRLQAAEGDSPGRIDILRIYLVVLALCFIIPVFYYCRMHCEDRQSRRLRDLERIAAALEESMQVEQHNRENSEETRALRKKYLEERRARILQLFGPVQMVLSSGKFKESAMEDVVDVEQGAAISDNDETKRNQTLWEEEDVYREETTFVEIPKQGLLASTSSSRLVPNLCAICLSNYEVGENIVWSSNPSCEHAFHADCMEHWLVKQRGPPLCPCCRRDFVIDPFDDEEEEPPHSHQEDNAEVGDLEPVFLPNEFSE